jgi:hypothetical protein
MFGVRKTFSKYRAAAVSFCRRGADAGWMIPLPLLAFGIIACLLGIIALMPDFESFGDDPYQDD